MYKSIPAYKSTKSFHPTPGDLVLDEFRKAFSHINVYVGENEMRYRFREMKISKQAKLEAEKLIKEKDFPLIIKAGTKKNYLVIKYSPGISACKRIMNS